jgi:hypothetical protein
LRFASSSSRARCLALNRFCASVKCGASNAVAEERSTSVTSFGRLRDSELSGKVVAVAVVGVALWVAFEEEEEEEDEVVVVPFAFNFNLPPMIAGFLVSLMLSAVQSKAHCVKFSVQLCVVLENDDSTRENHPYGVVSGTIPIGLLKSGGSARHTQNNQ